MQVPLDQFISPVNLFELVYGPAAIFRPELAGKMILPNCSAHCFPVRRLGKNGQQAFSYHILVFNAKDSRDLITLATSEFLSTARLLSHSRVKQTSPVFLDT
jgi:hypothetical protein